MITYEKNVSVVKPDFIDFDHFAENGGSDSIFSVILGNFNRIFNTCLLGRTRIGMPAQGAGMVPAYIH